MWSATAFPDLEEQIDVGVSEECRFDASLEFPLSIHFSFSLSLFTQGEKASWKTLSKDSFSPSFEPRKPPAELEKACAGRLSRSADKASMH